MKKLIPFVLLKKSNLIFEFLSKKIIVYLGLSIFFSFFLFLADLGMALAIQYFFNVIGLLSNKNYNLLSKFIDFNNPLNVISILFFVGTIKGFLVWGQTYLTNIANAEFETLNRKRISFWAFHDKSAELGKTSTLFNDETVGAGSFISSFLSLVNRLIMLFLLFFALIKMAPLLTLISIAVLMMLYIPYRVINKIIDKASYEIYINLKVSINYILVGVKNILLLHIYGLNKKENEITCKHLDTYLSNYRLYHFFNGLKSSLPQILGIWLICLITLFAKSKNLLDGNSLIAYFYLFTRLIQCLADISNLKSYLTITRPKLHAVWNWWIKVRPSFNKNITYPSNIQSFQYPLGWKINGLEFSYKGAQKKLFEGLSLNIRPGKSLVIMGESGSGKSTFISLLLGLNNPNKGSIKLVSKKNIQSLAKSRPKLLASIGYVGPESFIVSGTVRENLLYSGTNFSTDEELIAALKLAECHFVFNIKNGLDHRLSEQGEGLSAGQKQRLALARALLRKPKVLILDEATANLDSKTEMTLIKTLIKLKGKMTLIVISHRKSLLKVADQTLYLPQLTRD